MKTLPRTVWEVLKFEAVCKLLAVCLVYPLLSGVFRIYATSEGLHFNGGLIPAFLSPAGIVVVVFVALGATAFVYWEISTVIRIAALTRQAVPFTWREVWWGSLWRFGALRGVSLPVSGVFYLGVWPLCAIGYVNSLLPTLALPEFIYGELRRYGELGMAVMILIPALYYLAGMLCLFAPLYMALRRQRFFAAAGESLRAWKRSFWQNGRPAWQGPAVVAACLVWMNVATHIAQFWRRNRLDLVDFDAAFFHNLLYSQAFRIDFAYWLVRGAFDAAAMALFVRLLLAAADPRKVLCAEADPAWQGDAGIIAGVLRRRLGRLRARWLERWRRRSTRVAAGVLGLAVLAWACLGDAPPPLVHAPIVIGHRGSIYDTENTLPAFEAAAEYGADYVELDVQLSADGVPVVLHDGNLWRLAGQNLNVAELTAKELCAIGLTPGGFSTEIRYIPTLEEVLQWVQADAGRPGLLVELKPSAEDAAALTEAVQALVEAYGLGDRLLFMSQDYPSMAALQQAHPDWWVGYCAYASAGDLDEGIWQYDIDFLAVEESMVSNRLARLAQEAELPLYVWSVYDEDKMLQYLQMGVTGLITDFPDIARRVVDSYHAPAQAA